MSHNKTSFFLSGVALTIELLIISLFLSAKSYWVAGIFIGFFFLEMYRTYRKTKHITTNHLTRQQKSHRADSLFQARNLYWNAWYRFADASEHEYIAQKFNETIKKINHK